MPQCTSRGSLYLDMLEGPTLAKHTLVSLRGKSSQVFTPSAISDLHDLSILGFSATESMVGFLVRGTKGQQGSPGHGKSPSGYDWSSYHYYVAKFDSDAAYKGSVQLPASYQQLHLAIFPSGEFLLSGYDPVNSVARLLLLSSTGDVIRTLDFPAARTSAVGTAAYGSVDDAKKSGDLLGAVAFTPYNDDILVWRRNSSDAVLDVSAAGEHERYRFRFPQDMPSSI